MTRIFYILVTLLLFSISADASTIRSMEVIYSNGSFALRPPDFTDAKVLAANVAEDITVPTGANSRKASYVNFSSNCDFYANYTTTAAIPAADIADGTSPELNPTVRYIGSSVTTISVISASPCIITLAWYM